MLHIQVAYQWFYSKFLFYIISTDSCLIIILVRHMCLFIMLKSHIFRWLSDLGLLADDKVAKYASYPEEFWALEHQGLWIFYHQQATQLRSDNSLMRQDLSAMKSHIIICQNNRQLSGEMMWKKLPWNHQYATRSESSNHLRTWELCERIMKYMEQNEKNHPINQLNHDQSTI